MNELSLQPGRLRGVTRAWLLLAALTAAAALPTAALGATKHAPKAPSGLAFYSPPARLVAGTPGTVIWSRTVATPHALAGAARATLVLYRSVLPGGKPTAVSGLVFTPRGQAPKHGWKLISWAHGTTGIADVCAPSRAAGTSYVYPQFNAWLKSGYAIAQTDYQGLGTPGTHLYLIGKAEGASVVNAALAARHLYPSIGRRYVIAGHSQGGQSALFAAAESAHDAPGLTLLGVAAFAPASHLTTQFRAAAILTKPGGGLSALGGLILTGAAAVSQAIDLHALLTPAAIALLPAVQKECTAALSASNSWGGLAPAQIERPGANTTALYRVLDAENPALKIPAPVIILQGSADSLVFPTFTEKLRDELTAKGDEVTYDAVQGAVHGDVVALGDSTFTSWLGKRFG
jgi:pimeloyl-ACP methyl ester carboxylesterase